MISSLKFGFAVSLMVFGVSAIHATVVVQPIVLGTPEDYDNGMGDWSAEGRSWLTYSSTNSGTDYILNAKSLGHINPPPSSAFSAHGYRKVQLDVSWTGSTPPLSIPIATYQEWEKNNTSNAGAGVSFDGNYAIGSTGNTGYINDDLALDGYGEGVAVYSTGAYAGGQSSVTYQSGYAFGSYVYRFYP